MLQLVLKKTTFLNDNSDNIKFVLKCHSQIDQTHWCSSKWSRARTPRRLEWPGTPRTESWSVSCAADCCS